MAKDGTWGDHVVLLAAANYFQTSIRIISSLDREIVVHPEHSVADPAPLVLGHIHEFHYVSLQPRQGKTFLPITNILVFFFLDLWELCLLNLYSYISSRGHCKMIKFNFFLNNKLSLLNLNILAV